MPEKKINFQERKNYLIEIREKLFVLVKQNNAFNLRNLSRSLGRNDAYLQQYIKRGSPNYLPEEERNKLSKILNINSADLTPPWLKIEKITSKNIFKIKKIDDNKLNYIELPKDLLGNVEVSDESNLFIYEFNLNESSKRKKIVRVIVDTGIIQYEDNNNYILDDNNILFLANIECEKNIAQTEKKLLVRPLEKQYSPFRIKRSKLKIFGKVLLQSMYIYS
tara:strand:- start:244 stop:906 length:663 start_codon:yes stop_codon:yes gene_type:complete